ncbi:MAG: phosphoribosylaminoimidazolesuccinocarboxamide synthase [Bacteroidales bacterium]|jgi:phosphoribosylaminoimidazole-succinocarboxamide synthase|nr:phosphoribosylaminoimidazolesuccinocarboxamide synthase [Bacteroidales bacterium]MDD2204430.1 phosphoribosylaminoimidazolesuccinocarboxamide synthase [Bacteroidales bacterium]MDD3151687.1 phosphoribosylaminoimidazolesuccinocarboxamide synthase [Bacteroidales bacterium]MDD3913984.1 phosphoribosylaminoimidazolesuccinocarboxamide synthase [Bacteroidales bacterium]MDD4633776.1 phosphoribosylaminoimidazolesuccinocarboxamide synthase [Bacteroidales bacterium]
MENIIKETNYKFDGQKSVYHGKVRDVYNIEDKYLLMLATDRISAFDVVLPEGIPYKGQVLNQIAAMSLDAVEDILPNWKIATPDPMATFGLKCEPFKVEMVIRGYLAGHAWRLYESGVRGMCGVGLPDGMKENQKLPHPIITPTTKAIQGHDMDISKQEIINLDIMYSTDYEKLENYTYKLFERGSQIADEKGLILVDTKYEFGKHDDQIYLIDEIHTPDSSRYFYKQGYEECLANNASPKQLSKEFVRQWLMNNGFEGRPWQTVPTMTPEFINSVTERYIELYENITGEKFVKRDTDNLNAKVENNIRKFLKVYLQR